MRLLAIFLLALTGCNTVLPPALLPDQEDDDGLYGVGSCTSNVCIRALRANTLDTAPGQMLEINSAVLSWSESPLYTTIYQPHLYKVKPAIWIGRTGPSLLGLDTGSTLTLTVDDQSYTAASGYEWLMGSVLDSRVRLRSLGLSPVEVERDDGEFGLYVFDLPFAERMMTATVVEFEVEGVGGTVSGTVDGIQLERIQRHLYSWRRSLTRNR